MKLQLRSESTLIPELTTQVAMVKDQVWQLLRATVARGRSSSPMVGGVAAWRPGSPQVVTPGTRGDRMYSGAGSPLAYASGGSGAAGEETTVETDLCLRLNTWCSHTRRRQDLWLVLFMPDDSPDSRLTWLPTWRMCSAAPASCLQQCTRATPHSRPPQQQPPLAATPAAIPPAAAGTTAQQRQHPWVAARSS